MLTSRQPMFIWRGDQLVNLYTDPYRTILGLNHPRPFASPASEIWHELWPQLGPRAQKAMTENEGTYDSALQLIMERNGYPEETYYTFYYSPISDDERKPAGPELVARVRSNLRLSAVRRESSTRQGELEGHLRAMY